ncbi:hypothetical protein [Streptomyces sp. HNM0574]|uniref:hypothetical protein n=1 Tax=Streptomyces sp. HNM0574 TaxID=2714954 RepID=UPI001469EF6C|nr:hypothetical protein [Streptomyces sp. HNM0574]NLU70040.1 hypothetical protein [Streptomyces sp. HNM0574]
MGRKQRVAVAGVAALLMAVLGACGSSEAGSSGSAPGRSAQGSASDSGRETVSGLRDSVRHVTKKTVKAKRPHLVKSCKPATKKVKHTKRTGSGSKKRTRTWYTTRHYQKCSKVRKGTETYKRVVRPERWCVRLDGVKQDDAREKRARDDVWYRVDRETYGEVRDKEPRRRIEFEPLRSGC